MAGGTTSVTYVKEATNGASCVSQLPACQHVPMPLVVNAAGYVRTRTIIISLDRNIILSASKSWAGPSHDRMQATMAGRLGSVM